MTTQPILPAPAPPTELEQAFIEDEPPGLFPTNQDSNYGVKRKVFCDTLQDVADQLQTLYNERFPTTSELFLNYHEAQMGIPVNPPGLSISQRQQIVLSNYRRGPFTRPFRNSIIEYYIISTFGAAPGFSPSGISLAGGIPLFSGVTGLASDYYEVREDITNFHYTVLIDNRVTVDLTSLTRDLLRITPAGISFSIGTRYSKTGGAKSSGKAGGTHS